MLQGKKMNLRGNRQLKNHLNISTFRKKFKAVINCLLQDFIVAIIIVKSLGMS